MSLRDLDAIAVAVFDHGAAPPGVSDRQFRFDYLDQRIRGKNALSAFAYLASDIPPILTRLLSVARSAGSLDCPLVVMDTAPAAVLGATFDPNVASRSRKMIVNIGNFHTLAFRLGNGESMPGMSIEGVFEHHTGEIDLDKLEFPLACSGRWVAPAPGRLQRHGPRRAHYSSQPLPLGDDPFDVIVTGPRRSMFDQPSSLPLHPYFAVPFGDMMISGCFGLLAATADVLPQFGEVIRASMRGATGHSTTPWDIE